MLNGMPRLWISAGQSSYNGTFCSNLWCSIIPLISFQSSLAFLKSPPDEYLSASGRGKVDIIGGLTEIKKNVLAEAYSSQYEFTTALEELVRIRE